MATEDDTIVDVIVRLQIVTDVREYTIPWDNKSFNCLQGCKDCKNDCCSNCANRACMVCAYLINEVTTTQDDVGDLPCQIVSLRPGFWNVPPTDVCAGSGDSRKPTQYERQQRAYSDEINFMKMKCKDALSYLNDNAYLVLNRDTIDLGCNPLGRLKCCLGDESLSASQCRSFWGPSTKKTTACDAVMKSYCDKPENRDSEACACLNSKIPTPQCNDKTCRYTAAFKTDTMLNSSCTVQFVDCESYRQLDDTDRGNIVIGRVEQNCNMNTPEERADDPEAPPTTAPDDDSSPVWVFVVIVLIVCIFLALLGFILFHAFRKNHKTKSTTIS